MATSRRQGILVPDFTARPDRPSGTIPAIVQLEGNGVVIDLIYLNRSKFFEMLWTGTVSACRKELQVVGVRINCEVNSLLVSVSRKSANDRSVLCTVERDELFPHKNEPKFKDGDEIRPVIVMQTFPEGMVSMLGSTNSLAFETMRDLGQLVLWSVSRKKLWHKGAEESGNYVPVEHVYTHPSGMLLTYVTNSAVPVCHTNSLGCYSRSVLVSTPLLMDVPEDRIPRLKVLDRRMAAVSELIKS
ncbi:MAG: phosphoribosyl-AMP cyclohydrolase [Candidatus Pacebacteria bacterium]|nr:phosphoribosyl-AMP cyclohydrolase [Candidatus Paceibacterota bacterium]MDD5357180.1 phosphoribosyl-AMP cyclohydrolase [Candidatus Paceibacterota bacterium]